MITPKQPKKLECEGKSYVLESKFRVIDEAVGISIGPLYHSVPPTPGILFMPDLQFLQGIVKKPISMHRMIQPMKPATRSSRRRRT